MPGPSSTNEPRETTSSATRDLWGDRVRIALAAYLGASSATVVGSQRLADDLGMTLLDLSLLVLRFERIVRREFPFAVLGLVVTVDDLAGVVRAWAEGKRE
jgi:hypothetical protein